MRDAIAVHKVDGRMAMQCKGEVRGGDGKQGRSEGCGARMQLRDTRRGTGRGVVMMLLVPAEEVSGVRAGRRR